MLFMVCCLQTTPSADGSDVVHVADTKTDQCIANKETPKQVADNTGASDDLQEPRLDPVEVELKAQVSC